MIKRINMGKSENKFWISILNQGNLNLELLLKYLYELIKFNLVKGFLWKSLKVTPTIYYQWLSKGFWILIP